MDKRPKNKVYNVGLGRLPGKYTSQISGKLLALEYRAHAQAEAKRDHILARLPVQMQVNLEQVVEIEVFKGKLVKFVVRLPFTEEHVLCLVVSPMLSSVNTCGHVGNVLTVYLNEVDDTHETLNPHRMHTGS